jgi:glutamine synthetase
VNPYLLQAAVIAAGLNGIARKAHPGRRYDIDMYQLGHTVKDAPKLPLNLLDALRSFDKDADLKSALGEEFAQAYLKLKGDEWNSYASHFTQWERDNTLDV